MEFSKKVFALLLAIPTVISACVGGIWAFLASGFYGVQGEDLSYRFVYPQDIANIFSDIALFYGLLLLGSIVIGYIGGVLFATPRVIGFVWLAVCSLLVSIIAARWGVFIFREGISFSDPNNQHYLHAFPTFGYVQGYATTIYQYLSIFPAMIGAGVGYAFRVFLVTPSRLHKTIVKANVYSQ